jgi:hypothetical protein
MTFPSTDSTIASPCLTWANPVKCNCIQVRELFRQPFRLDASAIETTIETDELIFRTCDSLERLPRTRGHQDRSNGNGVRMSSTKVIRNLTAAGLTLLLVSAGGIANAAVINGPTTLVRLTATALGSNETGGLGVKTGSASAVFTLNVVKGTICYNLKDRGLVAVKYSHIHKGASGADGAVVVNLNAKNFNAVGNTCTSAKKTLLRDIVRNPSMYYFNVHTAAFPNGAVRGQLTNGKKATPVKKSTASPTPSTSQTPTPTPTKTSKY